MISRAQLLKPFAQAIRAKAIALRTLELTPQQRARLKESIGDDIRKATDLLTPAVSKAAHGRASRLGIDLCTQGWHGQPKFDAGRKVFHFEHCVTVAELRRLCMEQRSVRDVLRVLSTKPRTVWVLKEEDRRLTAQGHKSNRPDPLAAYRKAGIALLERTTFVRGKR
jgi:hypothetical protein